MVRVAVLLCGHVRTWDLCKESFTKTFSGCDVFAHTYDVKYEYHPYIHKLLGEPAEEIIVDVDIPDAKRISVEKQAAIPRLHHRMKDFTHGFSQYTKFSKCLDLMRDYENENNFRYDYIVKTRFDLVYQNGNFSDLFADVRDNQIIIDASNTYPNDHIIMGCRDVIANIPEFILNEYEDPTSELSWTNPPHGLLEQYIKCKDLNVIMLNLGRVVRIG